MEQNSLLFFSDIKQFREFLVSFDIYDGWKIREGLLNTRGKQIENKGYFIYLRELFKEKGFFYQKASVAEIVSWLDSMELMRRVFNKLEQMIDREQFNSMSLSCEYMIKNSKRMRIDYILLYKDNILVLEFRVVNSFDKLRTTWQKKFLELIVYKELISNYLVFNAVRLYCFVGLFEYKHNNRIAKNYEYNENQVNHLCNYIKDFLIK